MTLEFTNRRERDAYGKGLHKTAEYAGNPHKAILDFISPYISSVRLFPDKLLVATYRRAEKTEGGIFLTDNNLAEDMYQSAAGLVLAIGSAVCKDDGAITFAGFKIEPLDWVTFRPVNGSAREIAGLHCRFVQDKHIEAVIDDPTLIW